MKKKTKELAQAGPLHVLVELEKPPLVLMQEDDRRSAVGLDLEVERKQGQPKYLNWISTSRPDVGELGLLVSTGCIGLKSGVKKKTLQGHFQDLKPRSWQESVSLLLRPALELSSQGIDSFSLEKWRKEAII